MEKKTPHTLIEAMQLLMYMGKKLVCGERSSVMFKDGEYTYSLTITKVKTDK